MTIFIISVIALAMLYLLAYYFDYHRWFGQVYLVTGKSINPVYFILAIACAVAGRIISFDFGNPIGLIFYIAGGIFFIIAVYGIITKIK